MTNQTHSEVPLPGRIPSNGERLSTQVCYLPIDAELQSDGEQRLGVRAVEPNPDAKHAIRGNLYVTIELSQPPQPQPQPYTVSDLSRVSERLLGLVQTTYYTAKGPQAQVMERSVQQVHQAIVQMNQARPDGALRAGITCAALLKNRLIISCSGPALALIASDEALEQFPWHQSEPDPILGGSQTPEIHTYKRQLGGPISLFVGSNRWLNHFTVRKLLGTVAQVTMDDCEEIGRYLGEECGEETVPGILVAANLPTLPEGSSSASAFQPIDPTPRVDVPHTDTPRADVSPTDIDQPAEAESPLATQPPRSQPPHSQPSVASEPKSASEAQSRTHPLIRKQSSSLPTSVNASPPVVRAPEESEPPSFEQTQELDPTIEFRPGPSPSSEGQSKLGTGTPASSPERQPSNPEASTAPVRPLPVEPEPLPPQIPIDDDIRQYSREGSAERVYVEREAMAESVPHHGDGYAQMSPPEAVSSPINRGQSSERYQQAEPSFGDSVAKQTGKVRNWFGSLGSRVRGDLQRATQARERRSQSVAIEREAASAYDRQSGAVVEQTTDYEVQGDVGRAAYTPPPPASGSRARVIISLAILLTFLIFAAVYVTLQLQGRASTQRAEELIIAAESHMNNARASLVDGQTGNARVSLQTAQGYLVEAETNGGPSNQIDSMLREIQSELQEILHVTRLYGLVSPLVTFPFEVEPHRVLVVDQDVYILDTGQDQIIRYRLDETRTAIQEQAGSVVLKQGQNVEGVTVGPLIDIAWQSPIPGVMDKANLMVLDSNNNIFRYNQRVEGPALQTFGGQESWQTPIQIQTYVGRFYIADGGQGQIYRYNPGAYDQPPEPWLIAPNPEAISSLASMMIDGDIWLLFNQGLLFPYHQGEQQPFVLDDDIGKIWEPVDLFIGDQDSSLIYLADAAEERVLVFAKDGTYIRQLQAAEGNPLQELRGIFVDETARMIYMLTKRGLFQHPLVE